MKELVNKSYSFYCNDINNIKIDLLYNKALKLKEFKNEISVEISKNPSYFFNLKKYDWVTHFRKKIDSCNNQDISNAICDVYVTYENKILAFKKKCKLKVQKGFKKEYYKRNTKKFKKGDIKTFDLNLKETKLTRIISYLTKFYNEGIFDNIKSNPNNELKLDIVKYLDKYNDRLINLVKNRYDNCLRKVIKQPIEFKSLTYSSCTEQKQNIINLNKNKESVFNAIITLSGQNRDNGKLHIPVKYSRKHHGELKDYYKQPNGKGQRQISYTVYFLNNNKLRIILSKPVWVTTASYKKDYYGIDVNVKHNLFADRHGNFIDYERKLFNDYVLFLKKLDKKKENKRIFYSNNPNYDTSKVLSLNSLINKLSKQDETKYNRWKVRIKDMLKRQCNLLIKQCEELGFNHIVMEDLALMAKSFSKNDEFEGFKYSRLIRLLNLCGLKNIVKSIANKRGVQVTFVQPHYTSQSCRCSCIDKRNRITQENFECIACFFRENADTHSAGMIEDRLVLDVLRQLLLIEKDGMYIPRRLTKSKIKQILVECYDTNNSLKEGLIKL